MCEGSISRHNHRTQGHWLYLRDGVSARTLVVNSSAHSVSCRPKSRTLSAYGADCHWRFTSPCMLISVTLSHPYLTLPPLLLSQSRLSSPSPSQTISTSFLHFILLLSEPCVTPDHAFPLNFLRISLYCYCARAPCLFKSFCKSARKIFSLAHRPRGKQALITCSRSRKWKSQRSTQLIVNSNLQFTHTFHGTLFYLC